VAVGLVALYGIAGAFLAPPLIKKLVADKGGERLGRVVVLDDISINPFTLDATAKGFRILEADRKTPFVTFDSLDIEGSASSIYRLAPVADSITLNGLKVSLVRDGDTHYNLSDILERLAAAQKKSGEKRDPEEKPAQFSLSNIRLVNARIDFDDRPKGAKHQVTDINVAVPFISNLPRHLKEFVQPSFGANVNGSPLKLAGETLPFENSLRTHVALDLDSLDLRRYLEYSPVPLPVTIDSGKLAARLSVRFTHSDGKDPSVDIAGKMSLSDLGVSKPDKGMLVKAGRIDADIASFDPIGGLVRLNSVQVADVEGLDGEARVPAAEARNIQVSLKDKKARIESVASKDGVVSIKREPSSAASTAAESPSAEGSDTASSPWHLAVSKLELAGYRVTVVDSTVKPAVTHRVTIANLEASDVTNESVAKGTVVARLGLEKGGSVEVSSMFTLDPLLVNAKVDARRIDLVGLRPYATQFSTVALKAGAASAKGNVTLRGKGEHLKVAYSGMAEIANLATSESGEDLLNWKSVRTSGIEFAWAPDAPLTLAVADIVVDKAYSRLVVTPEGKLNVQQLRTATPEEPEAPATTEPKPRNVRIDRITFVDSRLNFTDHFIKPNYTADVDELQGTVTGLSSEPESRAVIDLKGSYDHASPVIIAGTVNPLRGDLFLDVAAKGEGIELPKLTAYSQRYAGYGITEGKLTLDVKYHVENGKLEGRNHILLERLTFGDKVESPEATKLPVLFAVNLLKDSNGEIKLELPIAGSLSDPQFEISGLITQVLGSLLKKAVTSPFSLLAAAFGGSGGNGGASVASRDGGSVAAKEGGSAASKEGGGVASKDGGVASKEGGGGDDLAFVDFDPGRSDIAPAGQRKLDTLSRALQGRPGLTLQMASRLDAEKDQAALRWLALNKQLLAGKGGSATAIDDAEYPRIVREAYARAKLPGKPEEMSVAELETKLLANATIGEEELRALASQRAEQVREYLVGKGQLAGDRVQVAAITEESKPANARASRVDFALR
jgi:uncharacterized protein involved in outer membrane biogenesis